MSSTETTRTARRIATGCLVAIGVLTAAHIAMGPAAGTLDDHGATGSASFVGEYLIVVRQPRNTIGWLLLAVPILATLSSANGDYVNLALVKHPGALPFGVAAAWLDRWLIVPAEYVFVPIFLLFPDGRVPSRRWRPVLWLAIAAPVVTIVSFALTPGQLTGAFSDLTTVRVMNPLGV